MTGGLSAVRRPVPQHVWFWVAILALSAGAGLLYDVLFNNGIPLAAAIYGFCIGASALVLERGALAPGVQARLRRLPTLLYVPIAEIAYVGMIALGHATGGLIVWTFGLHAESFAASVVPSPGCWSTPSWCRRCWSSWCGCATLSGPRSSST